MSVGVPRTAMPPNSRIRIAITTKVSGRRSAVMTMAFMPA